MNSAQSNRGERGERGGNSFTCPDPNPLASKRPGSVPAIIARSFKGTFSVWSAGEHVKAWLEADGSYSIERIHWTGSLVPLAHACILIPREALTFPPVHPAAFAASAAVQPSASPART